MEHMITYLDLSTDTVRSGQFWSDAPLVTGRRAVWVVSDGRPVHVHKIAARHRDTRRALARANVAEPPPWITGVQARAPWSADVVVGRYDLTRE